MLANSKSVSSIGMKSNKNKYSYLMRLIKIIFNYKKLVFCSAVCMIIYTTISAVEPRVLMELIDTIGGTSNRFSIKFLVISIAVLASAEIIAVLFSDYLFSVIGKKVMTKIKLDVMEHLFKLDGKYISKMNVGDHINILDSDTSMIEQIGTRTIFTIICSVMTMIFMLFMLVSIQWDIAIVILIFQAIITYLQIRFFKNMISMRRDIRNINGQITNVEQKVLGSFMNVIQLNIKKFVMNKLSFKQNEYVKSSLKFQWTCGFNVAMIKFMNVISLCYILVNGIHKISISMLTVGGLITIINYSQKLSNPIQNIINSSMQIQQALISLEKIFALLDCNKHNNGTTLLEGSKYEISFDNAKFSYANNEKLINYNNICFYPNTINVVVGKSGAGKSTLIKLLYRLWNIQSGSIFINDVDIRDYDIESLRLKIGIVNQNPIIFNDSVINNLILDRNVDIDKEFIIDICKKVMIHDIIMCLPEGYDTVLGDNKGITLSGGQMQRLEIARVLIGQPEILIMDEPTSALDLECEKKIWDNLKDILKQATTIIITHRKEVLNYADYVYDLSQ